MPERHMWLMIILGAVVLLLFVFNVVVALVAMCWYDPIGAWLVWTFPAQAIAVLLMAPATMVRW